MKNHKDSLLRENDFNLNLAISLAFIANVVFWISMAFYALLSYGFGKPGLNGHVFGALDFYDFFGLMEASGRLEIPWNSTQFGLNPWVGDSPSPYSSFGLFLFKTLSLFIPKSPQAIINSGVLFTILGVFSLCFPIFDSLKKHFLGLRFLLAFSIGVLGYPAILGFSRANLAILFVTPIYLIFKYSYNNNRHRRFVIGLSLLITSGIKFNYLPIFLLFRSRKDIFQVVFPTIISIISLYLLCFKFFPGDYLEMLKGHIRGLLSFTSREEENQLFFFNTSALSGVLTGLSIVLGFDSAIVTFFLKFTFLPGVIYLCIVAVLLATRKNPRWFIAFLLLSSIQMVPGISYPYGHTYLVVIIALAISDPDLINQIKLKKSRLTTFSNGVILIGIALIYSSDFFWLTFSEDIATSSKSLTIPLGTVLLLTLALRFPVDQKWRYFKKS